MDNEEREWLSGTISAQTFILQNLYALIIAQGPDALDNCERTAAEMLRQFEDLPPTGSPPPDDEAERIRQHGVHHLDRFWAGVRSRLQSAGR